MRFFKPILIFAVLLLILIIAISLNDWFTRWNGAIGILSLWLFLGTWIANFYYFRNERFFLLIQRVLLRFRRTDATWFFNVHYVNVAKNNGNLPWQKEKFAENLALLLKEVLNKPVLIKNHLLNRTSFCIDSFIHLTLRYSSDLTSNLSIEKLLVPAHRYKEYMHILIEVFSTVERELRAKTVVYSMHIEFHKQNPYFGFFIRHIPKDSLSKFRCTFAPSIATAGSTIDVQKSGIVITTDSISKLHNLAISYLSLSKTLITGEN